MRSTLLPRRTPRPSALGKDDVHIWRVGIDLPGSRIRVLEKTLAPDELAKARGFRFKAHRDRFVAARGMLRAVLSRYLDTHPSRPRFQYGPHGKPFLDGELGRDLRFNLSHANGLALYAVARGRELGIDLEQVRSHAIDKTIARQYFSDQESATPGMLPLHERPEAFFRSWTRREAYLKAQGEGLSGLPKPSDISRAWGDPIALGTTVEINRRGSQWILRDLDPGPGFVAAIVMEGQGSRLRLTFAEWPPE